MKSLSGVGLALLLVACGADDLSDAGLADAGLADAGLVDAGPADAGESDAGPACLLEWTTFQMSSVGGACGVGGDEGSQLCLELTVDGDGNVSGIASGPSNEVPFDGMTELCLMDQVAGRCVPRLAGASEEHCAYGP